MRAAGTEESLLIKASLRLTEVDFIVEIRWFRDNFGEDVFIDFQPFFQK